MLVICMILYTMFKSVQMGAADSGATSRWRRSADCWRCCSRTRTSACLRASDSWRCSASRCRPASSCWNTSTSCARAAIPILDAAIDGSVQRLRPIMMTMLVASFGLLPAALSRGIGSDSQRPFAIVIVGGLVAALILGVFLLPTLYVWVAGGARRAAGAGARRGGLGFNFT